MSWPVRRIGDFLTESTIECPQPSADRRIRVRLNAGGVEKRPLTTEKEGATRYFIRRAGQFIYGKQNLHKGAFGIVPQELDYFESSSDLPAFDIADGLKAEWLDYFLKQGAFYTTLASIARGAATKRIQPSSFFDVEIPVPTLEEQDVLIARMDSCVQEHSKLLDEIGLQTCLLDKLRHAIFEQAIKGDLTKSWRDENPEIESASEMLMRIDAIRTGIGEKKRARASKPLPNIAVDEIPYEIPRSWKWCRFGSYAYFERGKFSARPRNDKRFFGGVYPFIQIGSLDKSGSVITESPQTLNEAGLAVSKLFEAGTIAIAIVGGTIGNLGVLGRDMCFTDSVVGVRPTTLTCQDFILLMLQYKQPEIQSVAYQRAGQPNISLPNLTDILIPLPPVDEQFVIVERVQELMEKCQELNSEIAYSRLKAEHLIQSALQEAFSNVE